MNEKITGPRVAAINIVPETLSVNAIISMFNTSSIIETEKTVFRVTGIFKQGRGNVYGNKYYDRLYGKDNEYNITLVTSVKQHNELKQGEVVSISGFLSRQIERTGKIEILLNIIELLSHKPAPHVDKEKEIEGLLNEKQAKGHKDIDSLARLKFLKNELLTVRIFTGVTNRIEEDIKKAMKVMTPMFVIEFCRINLSSAEQIIEALHPPPEDKVDIICIARGGGDGMEIFEEIELCRHLITCKKITATAIGHAADVSLFQKLADRSFNTPTDFGHYLGNLSAEINSEMQQAALHPLVSFSKETKEQLEATIRHLEQRILIFSGQEDQKQKLKALQKQRFAVAICGLLIAIFFILMMKYFG